MALSSRVYALAFVSLALAAAGEAACSASGGGSAFSSGAGGSTGTASSAQGGAGNGTTIIDFDAGTASTGTGGAMVGDPTTCEQAAMAKTYIGCDFWPTVTANIAWSIFDFAVVVANAGMATADVTVTGPGVDQKVQVMPNALQKIYLPWVPSLKGGDQDQCIHIPPSTMSMGSVSQTNGAYHLISSVPVTVYQFSALEYVGMGGPVGKDWSSCPGLVQSSLCTPSPGCFSFTNDASLLLPSTAMTGNYRITGQSGWPGEEGAFFAVTGTKANTKVTVYVAPKGHVVGGGNIMDTPGGGTLSFNLDAGDVVELFGDAQSDNTGSLVQANNPVQIISGMPCAYQPFEFSNPACDHLEQTVLPAETLGKHYFVSPPTSPHNTVVGHIVRMVGNHDGTHLTYPSGAPPGAPTTLDAGEVVEVGGGSSPGYVSMPFEVVGDNEFAVVTFMLAGTLTDPNTPTQMRLGDPSQSNAITVEQYRIKYVFLAPDDYTESYADVTQPMGAKVTLDGTLVNVAVTPIGSGYGIARVHLGPGNGGAHVMTSTMPVGLQVIGYGRYTSYQYPGGLNLDLIALPPPPPI
jgi:hypothetical protein